MEQELLDELIAADAQGERVVLSLWPGDQFLFKSEYHMIRSMQLQNAGRMVFIVTEEVTGSQEMTTLTGETVEVQRYKTFLLYGMLLFPALLSDEHFKDENPDLEVW